MRFKIHPTLHRGFTLIELLIVVAIIAILAAIAVPNFLEAQTRAKVSRVKSDMRSLATGLETYRIDNNKYFPTTRFVASDTRTLIWSYMTTPVAYMTSVPQDPFNAKDIPDNKVITLWGPDYIDGNVAIRHRWGSSGSVGNTNARSPIMFSPYPELSNGTQMVKNGFWAMVSFGPDQFFEINRSFPSPVTPYDPTNGTVSWGDIVRTSIKQY